MTSVDDLARRVMAAFFQVPRNPGDPFWSMRQIATLFECTEYQALEVLKKLTVERYIKRVPGKGSFLEDRVDMKLLTLAASKRHPGVVPPHWSEASTHNVWTEFIQTVTTETQQRGWDTTMFNRANWGDIGFAVKFKMAGCNAMIAVDPDDDSAVMTFAELRTYGIPILVVGPRHAIYDKLGVRSMSGSEHEGMKMVMLRLLKERRITRPLFLNYGGSAGIHQRDDGCLAAYKQIKRPLPYDVFLEGPHDQDLLLKYMRNRLKSATPPDALIFHESAILDHALTHWPGLIAILKKKKISLVVYDDLHVADKWPSLKIIYVDHPTEEIARRSLDILERLLNGQSVPGHTCVARTVRWDS